MVVDVEVVEAEAPELPVHIGRGVRARRNPGLRGAGLTAHHREPAVLTPVGFLQVLLGARVVAEGPVVVLRGQEAVVVPPEPGLQGAPVGLPRGQRGKGRRGGVGARGTPRLQLQELGLGHGVAHRHHPPRHLPEKGLDNPEGAGVGELPVVVPLSVRGLGPLVVPGEGVHKARLRAGRVPLPPGTDEPRFQVGDHAPVGPEDGAQLGQVGENPFLRGVAVGGAQGVVLIGAVGEAEDELDSGGLGRGQVLGQGIEEGGGQGVLVGEGVEVVDAADETDLKPPGAGLRHLGLRVQAGPIGVVAVPGEPPLGVGNLP
jgi:hypothetical protein